jgi:hypothetical protein
MAAAQRHRGAVGHRGHGTTRPDLAGAGGSPEGVRLVRPTPVPATGPLAHGATRHAVGFVAWASQHFRAAFRLLLVSFVVSFV